MNKWKLFSKELSQGAVWMNAMKTYEARKTPTYEMQQRALHIKEPEGLDQTGINPIFNRVKTELTNSIDDIRADLADLPLQPAVVRG